MTDELEEIWSRLQALSSTDRQELLSRVRTNYGGVKRRTYARRGDTADQVYTVVSDLGYITKAIAITLSIVEPTCQRSSWANIVKKAQVRHNVSFDVRKSRGKPTTYLRPGYKGEVPAFTSVSKYALKHLWSVHVNGDSTVDVIRTMRSNMSDFPCMKTFTASKPVIMHITIICDKLAEHFEYERASSAGENPVYRKRD
jgi:hypothetical protein